MTVPKIKKCRIITSINMWGRKINFTFNTHSKQLYIREQWVQNIVFVDDKYVKNYLIQLREDKFPNHAIT